MKSSISSAISRETGIRENKVEAVIRLLDEGCTIPFIARYRKEATGELDEVQILTIRDLAEKIKELEKRRETILSSLKERELLTGELAEEIAKATSLTQLEDIYLPFRPKKRTRGSKAREAGLEPLAQWLLKQAAGSDFAHLSEPASGQKTDINTISREAEKFINLEMGIKEVDTALAGARDILAEQINETPQIRQTLRRMFENKAAMGSKAARGKKEVPEAARYRDYFNWSEPASKAPSHRILAVLRGTAEGWLSCHFLPDEDEAIQLLEKRILGKNSAGTNAAAQQIQLAISEGYKRLTAPSLETELKTQCKERADREAIEVFASNVRELLMSSPLGQKRVMALDPGLRTGCKLVCLNEQGDLLHHSVIYPLPPHGKKEESARIILQLCREWHIEALAVGNGTGGREAEQFAASTLKGKDIPVIMVNESGASVYSASTVAREEFPDQDVTVRGAVSIGRRLMDPLAELVKIDPKSIGVGQYQHDVNQKELQQSLDDVVSSCVNAVGVEVNTASKELLSYVSGISARTARAICSYREKNGPFADRRELLKVSGLGEKAFEQSAGFLRISGGKNPLDASAVHPESYGVVQQMAEDLHCSIGDLTRDKSLRSKIKPESYVSDSIGLPTLKDILSELEKPGRDPREAFEAFQFSNAVHNMEDLEEGMILPGIITNVTAFGAFVDIGVHQDGLVHISQLADHFVKDPSDVVKVNQKVEVKVIDVDLSRKRIGLSMNF